MQTLKNHCGSETEADQVDSLQTIFPIGDHSRRPGLDCQSRADQYRRDMPVRDTRINTNIDTNYVSSKQLTILSIGDDARLLETRQMVFASAGYAVYSMSSADNLDNELVQQSDLAVICHSVPAKLATQVATTLRNTNPALPILRLGDFRAIPDGAYDLTLQFPPRPEVLLKTLEQMLSRPM